MKTYPCYFSWLAVVLLVATGLSYVGCDRSSPTETVYPTGRSLSDYAWTIDSISYQDSIRVPLELTGMWGSSSSDIWGVAGDAGSPDDALWHRDSISWSRATKNTIFTDYTGNRFAYDIWGTASNNVWAVGRIINSGVLSAMIIHYNGSSWSDVTPATVKNIHGVLYTIHGVAANDIWAGGYEYAVHYNGATWSTFKVADSMSVASITGSGSSVYLTMSSNWGKNIIQLYKLSGTQFELIDQTPDYPSKFCYHLWLHGNQLLSMGYNIYSNTIRSDGTIDTSAWEEVYNTGGRSIVQFQVLSPSDIIAVGSVYLVCQYDGTQWKQFDIRGPNDPGNYLSSLFALWTNGNDIFVCNYHDGIIYHGK